jgi:hypothetical protein
LVTAADLPASAASFESPTVAALPVSPASSAMGGAVAVVLLTEQLIVVGVVWHEEIDDDAVANLGVKFSFYREKIGLLGFHIRI